VCQKESSHLALLEVPERAAQEPEQEPEQERKLQAPAQVLLGQEPAQEPELLPLGPEAQEPERAQTSRQGISLPETARAVQASDSPLHLLERGRRMVSQALPLHLKSPGLQAAPRVVNKTQPGKNQGP
jgi:hypothetical protein